MTTDIMRFARDLAQQDGFSINPSDPQYADMMSQYIEQAKKIVWKEMRSEFEAMANFRSVWLKFLDALNLLDHAEKLLYNIENEIDNSYAFNDLQYSEIRKYLHQVRGATHILSNQIEILADEIELTEGDFIRALAESMDLNR